MKTNFDITILGGLLSPNNTVDENGQYKLPFDEEAGEGLSPGDPWHEGSRTGTDEEIEAIEIYETEYAKRIKECFTEAYQFIETHRHPRTEEDWGRIAGSLAQFKDPLTIGLICECVKEFEREYGENKK